MNIYALGLLEKDTKILLLLRTGSPYFSGYYGLPGGKVEDNESSAHALIRELYEELGIIVLPNEMQFVHCLSNKNENGQEFLVLTFKITSWKGEPINKEPEKHSELKWFDSTVLLHNKIDTIIPRHYQIITKVSQGILYSENGW